MLKFVMLEFIARVPYQAWERVGYLALARYRGRSALAKRVAEHGYMSYVAAHPGLEDQPDPGTYAGQYGHYRSVADLLRQIGHDERIHKLDSLASLTAPRFQQARPASRAGA